MPPPLVPPMLGSVPAAFLGLMAEGLSNQGTAARLGLELKTVEGHVGQIFSKLGLEPDEADHRRVRAVLAWSRDADT